jgi:hypothetical protein
MRHPGRKRRRVAVWVAAVAVAAPCWAAADIAAARDRLPDAEIFATSTTALITDPADPRLNDRLLSFRREVRRIIRRGGGVPRGSRLLDGVFFSSALGVTTFERSRSFDVDCVSRRELHAIADAVRRRFGQQSVLTFDYPERRRDPVDAVEVRVPGVDEQRLRSGFLADAEARTRLMGASLTLDGQLILIARREDLRVVRRFVGRIGGRFADARIRRGRREFVTAGPSPQQVAPRRARDACGRRS